tara:strand:+ start:497 stop:826 length:330 start_codon:yes stop_codon:yes gene_type:complete
MTFKRTVMVAISAALIAGVALAGTVEAAPRSAKAKAAAAVEAAKVSLNKGDAKSLMQVNGVTAYKAHAIVAYRNKNGEFKNFSDLEKVKGFKRMTPEAMKAMSEHLSLE